MVVQRAAVPEWQIPVVKANVGNSLRVDPLFETLKLMFGADSMPHARDLGRVRNRLPSANRSATSRADAHWAEDDDADYYYDEEEGYWEEEEEYVEDDRDPPEDEYPAELLEAETCCDEALVAYHDARRKMKEIALSRGFYPIVALTPEAPPPTSSSSRTASSSHHDGGKGRGKGKHSRPATPSGAGPAGNGARPAGKIGLGRAAASRTGPPGSGGKGWCSGGPPRFVKRPRPEGHVLADYDVASSVIDECFYVDPGCGISDSGATRPVMGTETWTQWRAILEEKGRANEIKHEAADRSFRFGACDVKKSRHAVSFPIDLQGNEIIVKVYLVDGNVPFLVARPLLEEWGIVCDYRNRKLMILANGQWCPMLQNDKGHMISWPA